MIEMTALRRRIARTVIRHQFQSLVSESPFEGGEQEEDEEERRKKNGLARCGLSISDIVAVISVVSSVWTATVTTKLLADLASVLSFAFGVYTMYQNKVLSRLPSIRQVHNRLRQNTNHLRRENASLNQSVNRLEQNARRMETVEAELSVIAGDESNLRRMMEIVAEQRRVQKAMIEKLKAEVVTTIIHAVITSDRNRDFRLGPMEMESLIIRLGQIEGIEFDAKKFRQELRKKDYEHRSLSAIMSVLRNLMQEEFEDGEDAIFSIRPDKLSSKKL